MGIETGAEAVQETHGPHGGGGRRSGGGLFQGCLEGPEQNVEDGGGGLGPVVEVGPQTFGNGACEAQDTQGPWRGPFLRTG
jgi:hypothetical protein